MKSLLTILTEPSMAKAQLAAAVAFARAHDAHLDVLALGIDTTPVSFGQFGMSMAVLEVAIQRAEELATGLADTARTVLAAEGAELKWAVDVELARNGGIVELVGMRARLADLVILPQPYGENRTIDAEMTLESALFDGRAPLLVVPDGGLGKAARPERVVVAWNQSAEAMSAVRAALPLLKGARHVGIVVIDPGSHGVERSDPGGMLCQMLARHGVHADVAVLARTMPRVTDVLNRHLMDTGADLLVMGAYGHSRLREAVFGGATREMLERCPIAMLMAH